MDPLSDIVSMVTVEAAVTSRLEASGDWGLRFAAVPYAKFGVVHRGECWISAPDHPPVHLAAGDCYLFTAGGGYTMAGAADTPADTIDDAEARYAADAIDGWLRLDRWRTIRTSSSPAVGSCSTPITRRCCWTCCRPC